METPVSASLFGSLTSLRFSRTSCLTESPGGWFGLLDAEERIYKSLGSAQSPRSELTLGKWRSTRRNQGMLLDGRLTELVRSPCSPSARFLVTH